MAGKIVYDEHNEYYSEQEGLKATRLLPKLPELNTAAPENASLKAFLEGGFSPAMTEAVLAGGIPSSYSNDPEGAWALKSLGQSEPPWEKDQASGLSTGLLNLAGPISLQAVKLPMRIPSFTIRTSPKDGVAVHGLLRSVFGQVEMEPFKDDDYAFRLRFVARITRRFESEGGGTGKSDRKASPGANWPMRVLSSQVQGSYRVQINLAPVDKSLLSAHFESLCSVYGVCALASTSSEQVSGSRNNNANYNPDLGKKLMESLDSKVRYATGDSVSHSHSYSGKELAPELILPELKQQAEKAREAINTGGWTVEIVASADDEAVLRMLESVMTGAFNDTPFQLDWRDGDDSGRDAFWIARSDADHFVQVPNENFPGFERKKNYELSLSSPTELPEMPLELGKILWNGEKTDVPFLLAAMAYNRHAFVCGMTGAGKTNTMFHHLKGLGLPFLVIEPVKTEYFQLQDSIPGLQTRNMNPASMNVLRVNPFWFPKGGSLSYHMGSLKTIISSAFVLYSAMPNILEQCLTRVYARCGWNVASGTNVYDGILPERYLYPNFTMLCEEIDTYLNESEYTGETLSTYRGALLTRLRVFTSGTKGILFDTWEHPDYDSWQKQSVVVELDELSDDADKCIALGVLTLQYFESVRIGQRNAPKNKLRHLFVIEEAHRLFKRTEGASKDPESASPEQQLVETLSNMMAEIRSYGEGMFIVDQSPAKVAEDVIRNSSVKLVHRLDNQRDIEIIEASLRMKDASGLIATLLPGQALVCVEKMPHAAMIQVPREKDNENEVAGTNSSDAATAQGQQNETLISYVQADAVLEQKMVSAEMSRLAQRLITSALYDILTPGKLVDLINGFLEQAQSIVITYAGGARLYLSRPDFLYRLVTRSIDSQLNARFEESAILAFKLSMLLERCFLLAMEGKLTINDVDAIDQYRYVHIWEEMRRQILFSTIPEYVRIRNSLGSGSMQIQPYWEVIRYFVSATKNREAFEGKSLEERRILLIRSLDGWTLLPLEETVQEFIVQASLTVAERLYGKAIDQEDES